MLNDLGRIVCFSSSFESSFNFVSEGLIHLLSSFSIFLLTSFAVLILLMFTVSSSPSDLMLLSALLLGCPSISSLSLLLYLTSAGPASYTPFSLSSLDIGISWSSS